MEKKWNAFYYRTRANVDYTHQFNKLDLNIAGNFGLSNFNFQPESVNSSRNSHPVTSMRAFISLMRLHHCVSTQKQIC